MTLFIRLLDSGIVNFDSEPYLFFDFDQTASPHLSDTEKICDSDVEVVHNALQFDKNWTFLFVTDVEEAPVCRCLDELIRDGFFLKDQIFYRYLDNMTQIYYNSKHPYDKDVIEFFASVVHYWGESNYNIVPGPMGFANKKSSSKEISTKLGGPGNETLR